MEHSGIAKEFHPESFKKEQVLRRLRKKVVELWGIQDTEIDQLDPMVELLLGACAVEFERTGQEMNSSYARVLERLAHLMVPGVFTNARPAHGIVNVTAALPKTFFREEDQLSLEKETQEASKIYRSTLIFSPVITTQIFDAAVVCQASGEQIVQYDNPLNKGNIFHSGKGNALDPCVFWIGVDASENIQSLEGMSFYFDWKNEPDKLRFLPLLAESTLSSENKSIEIETGLVQHGEVNILSEFDGMSEIEKNILHFYHPHFLTITEKNFLPVPETYPKEFENVFLEKDLEKLQLKITWLKLKLPEGIPIDVVSNIYVSVNSVPVMNRRLHTSNRPHALTGKLNSIPLSVEGGNFLAIGKIYSSGREYTPVSLKNIRGVDDGTYALRQGGAARFDKRDAATMLQNLYEMMRDESAAFSSFGNTTLISEIRAMEQILARLQMHLSQQITVQTSSAHLLVYTNAPEDVYVEFWSTQGELGNKIPSGKKAVLLNNAEVKKDALLLLTTTSGGRAPLNESETLHAYKYTLMTRSRIATEEDIKAACFAELGDRLAKVEIKKGVMKDLSVRKGFVRTLDIVLFPKVQVSEINWHLACRELKAILERRKMFTMAVQVFTIHEQKEYVA